MKMDDYKGQIESELNELEIKVMNLGIFINNIPEFKLLPDHEQTLLTAQFFHMSQHAEILRKRIELR